MTQLQDCIKSKDRITQSYFINKMLDLIEEYQKLEKDEPYIKIPFTNDEWELIKMRLKDF